MTTQHEQREEQTPSGVPADQSAASAPDVDQAPQGERSPAEDQNGQIESAIADAADIDPEGGAAHSSAESDLVSGGEHHRDADAAAEGLGANADDSSAGASGLPIYAEARHETEEVAEPWAGPEPSGSETANHLDGCRDLDGMPTNLDAASDTEADTPADDGSGHGMVNYVEEQPADPDEQEGTDDEQGQTEPTAVEETNPKGQTEGRALQVREQARSLEPAPRKVPGFGHNSGQLSEFVGLHHGSDLRSAINEAFRQLGRDWGEVARTELAMDGSSLGCVKRITFLTYLSERDRNLVLSNLDRSVRRKINRKGAPRKIKPDDILEHLALYAPPVSPSTRSRIKLASEFLLERIYDDVNHLLATLFNYTSLAQIYTERKARETGPKAHQTRAAERRREEAYRRVEAQIPTGRMHGIGWLEEARLALVFPEDDDGFSRVMLPPQRDEKFEKSCTKLRDDLIRLWSKELPPVPGEDDFDEDEEDF